MAFYGLQDIQLIYPDYFPKPIVFNSLEKEDLLAFLATLNDSVLVSNQEFQKK